MSATHVVAVVLVVSGTGVLVAAAIGAVAARNLYARLHFATPMTSLGGPLIAIGLAVQSGTGFTIASLLLPAALMFLAGPLLSAAIGRVIAQQEGRVDPASPQ